MHIHILGICGTFMGGIAMIAKNAGFKVTGSDTNIYPPMSDELIEANIEIFQGYGEDIANLKPDLFVIGNVMKRGMPIIEYILKNKLPYTSGPQWLYEHYLKNKITLAVAGTHGKTTTSSMLTWILEKNGLNPGFLIGGVTRNFNISARNTDSRFFVIEADEYDCAFFDKRSKFVHYHPDIAILNNLEFDHADIFDSIEDIKKQFHHLVRTIPCNGDIIVNNDEPYIKEVLDMGLWSNLTIVGNEDSLHCKILKDDCSSFALYLKDTHICDVNYNCTGIYNVKNALCAIAAASKLNLPIKDCAKALETFLLPKRRMELIGSVENIDVYDDFAHHPTAIALTIKGLRDKIKNKKLIAVFEPRSNSMKMGAHAKDLPYSFKDADIAFIYAPENITWDIDKLNKDKCTLKVEHDFDNLIADVCKEANEGSSILVMSNGSFNGIHKKILEKLAKD